jgi:ABC-type polar amino acid transport system ATPase subunit/GNAT superfamily N-acetyltransferase
VSASAIPIDVSFPSSSLATLIIVRDVQKKSNETLVLVEDGSSIHLPPFAYVRAGDLLKVEIRSGHISTIEKQTHFKSDDTPDHVQLFPQYDVAEDIYLPPHNLKVRFRERRNQADMRALHLLERFHYRGNGFNKIVGRRTILLAEAEGIGIIGYGVISSTVLTARPRFKLFNTNLCEQMRTKLINKLARIPRIVVHPEYRSLGLGARIAKHLVQFAAIHWDINGYKSIMVEVIASMTEYHKFFEVAGFIKAGYTKGEREAVFKPLYGRGEFEARPNSENYNFSNSLGPKPYLIYPLTEEVQQLVNTQYPRTIDTQKFVYNLAPTLEQPIKFKNVSLSYLTKNELTPKASKVKEIFGVDSNQMSSLILHKFNLDIEPGDVVLVTGASGSGKSTLIKLLIRQQNSLDGEAIITGELVAPDSKNVAILNRKWRISKPLVDQVGGSIEESISLLNSVGLAEAHLYLKRPNQISEGQRYRFAVARLCDSKRQLWIADEFASTLDPYTAAIVAKGIRKQALMKGATLVIAAPHIDNFAPSLVPTKLVRLQWGGKTNIHAIKMSRRMLQDGIEFRVANKGRAPLTGIELTVMSLEGEVQTIASKIDLMSRGDIYSITIPFSELVGTSSLRAYAREGVGDIVLFNQICR